MAIDVGGDGSIVQVCNVLHHFLLRAFPENYESRAVETRGDLVGVGLHLTHTLSGFDIVLVFSTSSFKNNRLLCQHWLLLRPEGLT